MQRRLEKRLFLKITDNRNSTFFVWYSLTMILQTTRPYTAKEIVQLQEEFDTYIKTVIDIEKQICVAGMNRHFEGEALLLETGSKQSDIWGGGIDLETGEVDFNSFINIRPKDNNTKNEIQSETVKKRYKEQTDYFFKVLQTHE